jgi:hypothetical protein
VLLGAGIDVEVCHVREKGVSQVKVKTGKSKNKANAAAVSKAGRRSHPKEDHPAPPCNHSHSKLGPPRNSLLHPIIVDDSDDEEAVTTHNDSSLKRARTMSNSPSFSAKRERLL